MKYIIFLGDGMADYPIKELGGKTPLEAADTPNIDKLCKKSRLGKFITIPEGMSTCSGVANLSVLGYDVRKCFEGRGVLEAANMGIKIKENDVALRCNVICVENKKIKNHSAGHISSEEAAQLIKDLDKKLGNKNIKFYPGVSYRHLLVLNGNFSPEVECFPPHDHLGEDISKIMVKPKNKKAEKTAELLNKLILDSQSILERHPINIKRKNLGKDPANSIWPWSPGKKPKMETMQKRFKIKGAVISAVDLLNGIGVYAGFDVINVKGATGLYNTNYEGKADACVKALKTHDFVYVHVEGIDEAGHEGNMKLKIKTIEDFDKRLIGRVISKLEKTNEKVRIAVLPDHFTPIKVRTHTKEPVPVLIYDPDKKGDNISEYNEKSAEKGSLGLMTGDDFIRAFLGK